MSKHRIIAEFESPDGARKVEETVKTGYAETSIENILHWIAVEEDLADNYERLTGASSASPQRNVYAQLTQESRNTVGELSKLLTSLEALDRARVKRIETLTDLLT